MGLARGRTLAARLAHAFAPPERDAAGVADRAIARLAAEARRLGLGVPAAVAVEAHRPLLPLYGQALAAAGPVLDALLPGRAAAALGAALEDPAAADALLDRLRDGGEGAEAER